MKALGGAFGITDPPGVDLPGLDVAAVAEGLGVPARKVEVADDLDSALRDAFGAGGPTLTNVLVDPAVDPLY
jgi:thiamine pyrophosphate-dependent acetolactate synthase large subunit-like protein